MSATSASLSLAGSSMRHYRHACAFFYSIEEEYETLVRFVAEGLARGERSVSVVSTDVQDHFDRLSRAGIEVPRALERKQLHALDAQDTYLCGGRFDPKQMLATVRGIVDEGHLLGFSRTRLIMHCEPILADPSCARDLVEYEMWLTYLLSRYPDPVVCAYDLRRISAAAAIDLLRAHPMAIIGGALHDSPFVTPPKAFLSDLYARLGRPERWRWQNA